jgi:alpha-tubulin suppressor-like RCC1 family protein
LGSVSGSVLSGYTKLEINNVSHISCGAFHTVLVQNSKHVYSSGWNSDSQLGRPDTTVNTFIQIPAISYENKTIKAVKCGNRSSIILTLDHSIYVCGSREHGNMAGERIKITEHFDRLILPFEKNITKILTGYHCTAMVVDDKQVWISGLNSNGMFGTGSEFSTFTKFTNPFHDGHPIKAFCGYQHFVVLDSKGRVWAAGENIADQTGHANMNPTGEFYEVLPHISFTMIGGGYHSTVVIRDERIQKRGRMFSLLSTALDRGYFGDVFIKGQAF